MAATKREKAWKSKLTPGKQYSVDEALTLVKEFATAKFNETVDASVNLGIDASNKQVRKSIVIVVAPDTSQPVTSTRHAGLLCDISECAIAIVAIKCVANRDAAVVQIASIYEVDILKTVAIKVGHADAGTKFFPYDCHAVVALVVDELDARLGRNIGELHGHCGG